MPIFEADQIKPISGSKKRLLLYRITFKTKIHLELCTLEYRSTTFFDLDRNCLYKGPVLDLKVSLKCSLAGAD